MGEITAGGRDWTRLSDRDLLILTASGLDDVRGDVKEIKRHQERQNGTLTEVVRKQHQQEGALSVTRWLIGVTLTVMTIGVMIAGLVLGLVIRGA